MKSERVGRRRYTRSARTYCEYIGSRVREDNASHSDGVENLFRSAAGQGCRKYDPRAPAGHFPRPRRRAPSRPLRGGFQRTKRERRDTARRERERSGSAPPRNQKRKCGLFAIRILKIRGYIIFCAFEF